KFKCEDSAAFWCSLSEVHPKMSEIALRYLLLFTSTYKCETVFSTLVTSKPNSEIVWSFKTT
ncbi:hypothetical protein CAPTEDRAFT_122578, partial [Capitella teleta]